MAKPSITTRTAKGSPLTIAEMDANLTNIKDGFIKIAVASTRTPQYPSGMVTLSTAQIKFGERSAQFNGTTNGFQITGMGEINASPWSVSSMTFSAEQFIWIDSTGTGERTIFDTRTGGGHNGLHVFLNGAGLLKARRGDTEIATSATALATNTWLHVAVERFSYGAHPTYTSGLYLLVNGAVVGQWANSMDSFENSNSVRYGQDRNMAGYFKGFMDEVRWSKNINRYMPTAMGSILPPPTAELNNDGTTSYLFHMNDQYSITDDIFNAFNLDLNDKFIINKTTPTTLTMDAITKSINIGVDTSALTIPTYVAVQTANSFNHSGARNARLDFGYNEIVDMEAFVNGFGEGRFTINNATLIAKNYLIELYGDATTAATGTIELYNHSMSYQVGNQYTIAGGRIPFAVWQINITGQTVINLSIGKVSGSGSETLTGGMMFMKITRL